jgi:hypothetical protein
LEEGRELIGPVVKRRFYCKNAATIC